jgi:protein-disulfide isomerase
MKNNFGLKMAVLLTIFVIGSLSLIIIINNNYSESTIESRVSEIPNIKGQPTIGEADASVSIVEFGDFKCPACKKWGETIYPQLISDYIDSKKAKFSYINVLYHGEESKLSALAAESVLKNSPKEYWDFHKELFKEQSSDFTFEKIIEISERFSTNTKMLKTEIKQESQIEEINKDASLVQKFGVKQTPTILINDIIVEDPFNYEKLKSIIESELKEGN